MSREAIQAVVFDAYGTIFDVYSVTAECESQFPGHGPALAAAWRVRQLEYTWLRSLMGRHAGFEEVTRQALTASCRVLGLKLTEDGSRRLVAAYRTLAVFPDVRETLDSLRGRKLAILSNGSREMLDTVVANAGLGPAFAAVLSVDAVGVFKPHPTVYALVEKTLGVAPAKTAFVSSNYWDIAGATAFGFRTLWINRAGGPPDELSCSPYAVLRSFAEIPAQLS